MRNFSLLEDCNCFATRQAARYITRLYEKHLDGAHLTSAQFSILVSLDEKNEMSMSGLSAALVMDRTTLLRALKPLQRDGLLKSQPNKQDTRQLLLSLSPGGQRRLKIAARLWHDAQREFEKEVGPSRAARMRRDLLAVSRST
jgi:DNA-binding MarR family transcriptional regulator